MVSAVFLLACLTVAAASCPEGWTPGYSLDNDNFCYWYSLPDGFKASWDNARIICQAKDPRADLASISDLTEQGFLVDTMGAGKPIDTWIGLNDVDEEGTFEWSDGSAVTFQDWWLGNPDGGDSDDCVHITDGGPNGEWSDSVCSNPEPFVCKMPATP